MANNDSNRDESQVLRIVYKIAHALEMYLTVDPLYGWYSLKSLCTDENIDRNRLVEMYGDYHLRLNIFMSVNKLLHTILHSEAIFIPVKGGFNAGFSTHKIANPFYGLTVEEAAIKADLEGERERQKGMTNNSATVEIVQKIAHALNLKVSSIYNNCLILKSLREDADPISYVELSSPGHLRMCTFVSYENILYHILHSKSIHIHHVPTIDRPFRDDWIQLVNPFYHLAPEEAAIKADLDSIDI